MVNADGVTLTTASNSPASALTGIPKFANSSNLTPDFYAVNTMQPPYQPSGNAPAAGDDANLADPNAATTLPPQTNKHIGDLLNDAGVSWAWYGGSWGAALTNRSTALAYGVNAVPNIQTHHQPFNYFADLAPGTTNRATHLLDGGTNPPRLASITSLPSAPSRASTLRIVPRVQSNAAASSRSTSCAPGASLPRNSADVIA